MSQETARTALDQVLADAAGAAGRLAAAAPVERARWLCAIAAELREHTDELVKLAEAETRLPAARLQGEVNRAGVQLELLADVIEEGSYVEAVIDLPDPDFALGPKPDLRRMLVPVGPVAVYAASNFPFAFSVAGNDTASALAAGCPVVVKAHPGHPETSRRTAELVLAALDRAGAPEGTFALVEGMEPGIALVKDERIAAAGFTGSVAGGRSLFDLATSRPRPIKFFGELGSINPVIVTERAADQRSADIAEGFVGSYTLGVGQFCTKPGLLFVPAGHPIVDQIVEQARKVQAGPMLYDKIADGYGAGLDRLRRAKGVRVLVDGGDADGLTAAPSLLAVGCSDFLASADALLTECFGPTSVLVEYTSPDELTAAVATLEGSLTTGVHGTDEDALEVGPLIALLASRSGRVLWNGWPTGVAVTWAMTHGGPYPASTLDYTSVGATSIDRWLRPVSFQSAPAALLPAALHNENPLHLMRRVNGKLTTDPIHG
ncbi:MAG: aldehyde dehydrogenase (NADP(+)) [Propionibacteriaceae bacterium]